MLSINAFAHKLKPYYQKSRLHQRLHFSSHSHQAWPDVAYEAYNEYSRITAQFLDRKWPLCFEKIDKVRGYLQYIYDDKQGQYSLANNTHSLLVSFLSSLDLSQKRQIITTDSEFYSLNRQLLALKQHGIEVVFLNALADDLAEQVQHHLSNKTACVVMSRVFFDSGFINQHLTTINQMCRKFGTPLLIDDYHATSVLDISLEKQDLLDAYVLVGGYKYLQWGEGNCFLRFSKDCLLKPSITGWFAAFSQLGISNPSELVFDEHAKFMSGTLDTSAQFRAVSVIEFFKSIGITPSLLALNYQAQNLSLKAKLKKWGLADLIPLKSSQAGFITLELEKAKNGLSAGEVCELLYENYETFTDHRQNLLRLGLAPYQSEEDFDKLCQQIKHLLDTKPTPQVKQNFNYRYLKQNPKNQPKTN